MYFDSLNHQFKILDSILHGVILINLKGHIIFWNKANEVILGYEKEEVLGKSIYSLYGDEASFKSVLERSLKGKPMHGRWYAKHKMGNRVWLDVRFNVINDDDGTPKFCVITICDIRKQKTTENRLRSSMAISQAIFETSREAMITFDEKGNILTCNQTASRLFKYPKEELLGKNAAELLPFPHNISQTDYIVKSLKTGENKLIRQGRESQAIRKDGSVIPIEISVSKVHPDKRVIYATIIRDISDRREMEKKVLKASDTERKRIGRELHDGLGQMLTGIRMLSENLARKLKANAVPGADEVKEISEMVKEADEYTRVLSRGMVQVDVVKKGLSVALQNLCDRISKVKGIACVYYETGKGEIDDHTTAVHLYRIAQEAISNAVKHSEAKLIKVRLTSNEERTVMIIDDDGVGFCPDEQEEGSMQGAGLQIMKYRATVLGGILEIVRTQDDITRVRCIIPDQGNYAKKGEGFRENDGNEMINSEL